ncbi:uncharacterized protein [Oryza sativa Japonica Group]|uniref:Uncharacterized protein n=2 Tax=Oryza sativa subsp. japonica TaxID=39947 RepID=Q7G3C7_ORYSJ|nr:uncharacterized protein LOC112936558 [Oryza sativa Japonica Group]AAM18744.1 hypothetical protein [Oryza sativa Japonica Group]AAP53327.1 hypothetical protein LOC_Os10g21970 [Oryza sativa Japonica Group]
MSRSRSLSPEVTTRGCIEWPTWSPQGSQMSILPTNEHLDAKLLHEYISPPDLPSHSVICSSSLGTHQSTKIVTTGSEDHSFSLDSVGSKDHSYSFVSVVEDTMGDAVEDKMYQVVNEDEPKELLRDSKVNLMANVVEDTMKEKEINEDDHMGWYSLASVVEDTMDQQVGADIMDQQVVEDSLVTDTMEESDEDEYLKAEYEKGALIFARDEANALERKEAEARYEKSLEEIRDEFLKIYVPLYFTLRKK